MSLITRGDIRTKPCLHKAGGVNYHVYHRTAASIHPDLRPWYHQVEETWRLDGVIDEPEIGLYGQFWVPRQAPEAAGYCPPVLAFRGSETEPSDFAKLGLVINFDFDFDSNLLFSALEGALDLVDGVLSWWKGGTLVPVHGAGQNASHEEALAFVRGLSNQRTIAAFSGRVPVTLTRPSLGPLLVPIRETITIGYRISATLHFDHQGDWGTNVTQGMGEATDQYRLAAAAGEEYAKRAIDDHAGKLIVTGHSLGGGLAATAAISGKYHHSDCDITCVTYNAAGVHPNTVKSYVNEIASLGQNPSTRNFSVEDEVLTTLQIFQEKLPFVAPFIRWANAQADNIARPMGFSAARNDTFSLRGVSPGMTSMGIYAPAYDQLPKLWPVSQNTIAAAQVRLREDPATEGLVERNQAALEARSSELTNEYSRLRDELDRNPYFSAADRARATEIQDRLDAIDAELAELPGLLDQVYETRRPAFPDTGNIGNFPVVTQLDAMARGCASADAFVTGLFNFLLSGEMNQNRANGIDLGFASIGAARARAAQLQAEFAGIAPIGVAAVAYHTFDPCAFTFHNPRG